MKRPLVAGLAAMVALRLVVTAAFVGYQAWTGRDDLFAGGAEAVVVVAAAGLAQALVVLGMCRTLGISLGALGWSGRPASRDVLLGLGGFAVIAGVMVGAVEATGGSVAGLVDGIRSFTPSQRVTFVLIGGIAAFAEESVFRGHLQGWAIERLGKVGGVVAVAALFDVYHLAFAPLALAIKLVIGLVLGVLRLWSGSLWPSAIAHALIWIVIGAS